MQLEPSEISCMKLQEGYNMCVYLNDILFAIHSEEQHSANLLAFLVALAIAT